MRKPNDLKSTNQWEDVNGGMECTGCHEVIKPASLPGYEEHLLPWARKIMGHVLVKRFKGEHMIISRPERDIPIIRPHVLKVTLYGDLWHDVMNACELSPLTRPELLKLIKTRPKAADKLRHATIKKYAVLELARRKLSGKKHKKNVR